MQFITATPRRLTAVSFRTLQVEQPPQKRLPLMVLILQLKIDALMRIEHERRQPFTTQDERGELFNRYPA